MAEEKYERPEARVVEFGQGDMGRYVTTSGEGWDDGTKAPGTGVHDDL